jgi:hypothetical protein
VTGGRRRVNQIGCPAELPHGRRDRVIDVEPRFARLFAGPAVLPELRIWLREHPPLDERNLVDAELVCTELVTNAIEHARAPREMRIDLVAGVLRIEVSDGAPTAPLTPGRSRLGGLRGRGLTVVTALARWGVERGPDRKTVWAEVPY